MFAGDSMVVSFVLKSHGAYLTQLNCGAIRFIQSSAPPKKQSSRRQEEPMRNTRYRLLLAAAMLGNQFAAPAIRAAGLDDPGQAQGQAAVPQKCLEALVNPVSGHAECVRPVGAPVEQPRRQDFPCATHSAGSGRGGQGTCSDAGGNAEPPK